jgi:hypothetical protein
MRIFISSIIRGFEPYRDAAAKAAKTLRHEVKRAEDFGASPDSPQRVCLAGVRDSEVTVLLLGANYGQSFGPDQLSPTHEEYREARDRTAVLVFVQEGVTRDAKQQAFVDEVQTWSGGHYTAGFSSPENLQEVVTRALYDLALSRSVGPVDDSELIARAKALAPKESRGFSSASLCIVVVGGPKQSVIRPAQLESEKLSDEIIERAMFGPDRIFDRAHGSGSTIENHSLHIRQERASVLLTGLGEVRLLQPARPPDEHRGFSLPAMIEEDLQERIGRALRFAGWLLDHIDPNRRLHTVVPLATVLRAEGTGWMTRSERSATPGRMQMRMNQPDSLAPVLLDPPLKPRPALVLEADQMGEDLTVLLRRQLRP